MARKLSRIANHGCLWLAVVGILPTANSARAQSEVQISQPQQPIIQNPFAKGAKPQPVLVPEEPSAPRRVPTTYHNPFAMRSTSPPTDIPQRASSISRWQRTTSLPSDPSSVKTAILSGDQPKSERMQWDQLSADDVSDEAANSAEIPASAEFSTPPDPIQFARRSLQQPAWLTVNKDSVEHVPPPVGSTPNSKDPFDLPASIMNETGLDDAESADYLAEDAGNSQRNLSKVVAADADLIPTVVADYVDSPDGWYQQAEQAAQSAQSVDQLSTVVEFCQRGLDSQPKPQTAATLHRLGAWACNRRGELQIDAGQQHEALQDFQHAISWDANCSLAIHNRAVTLAQQEQYADALRDFNRVIELNPGLAVAYRNRAELLASLGRMDEAVRDYSEAIKQLPSDAEVLRARGDAYHRLGEHDRALADLNAAIQLAPKQPAAYTQRGNLSAERGDFDHALTDFQHALDLDSGCVEAYRSLAWLQSTCPDARFRDAVIAVEAANRAVKLTDADDCYLLDALAAAHANAGNYNEAAQVLEQGIRLAPIDFAPQLRERLELYRQNRPYRSGPVTAAVRTASHESSPSPRPSPAVRKPKSVGMDR